MRAMLFSFSDRFTFVPEWEAQHLLNGRRFFFLGGFEQVLVLFTTRPSPPTPSLCALFVCRYGARGTGPIPANQDLVFRVELIDVLGK